MEETKIKPDCYSDKIFCSFNVLPHRASHHSHFLIYSLCCSFDWVYISVYTYMLTHSHPPHMYTKTNTNIPVIYVSHPHHITHTRRHTLIQRTLAYTNSHTYIHILLLFSVFFIRLNHQVCLLCNKLISSVFASYSPHTLTLTQGVSLTMACRILLRIIQPLR